MKFNLKTLQGKRLLKYVDFFKLNFYIYGYLIKCILKFSFSAYLKSFRFINDYFKKSIFPLTKSIWLDQN